MMGCRSNSQIVPIKSRFLWSSALLERQSEERETSWFHKMPEFSTHQRENYEEEVEMILDDRLQLREIETSAIVAERTLQPLVVL